MHFAGKVLDSPLISGMSHVTNGHLTRALMFYMIGLLFSLPGKHMQQPPTPQKTLVCLCVWFLSFSSDEKGKKTICYSVTHVRKRADIKWKASSLVFRGMETLLSEGGGGVVDFTAVNRVKEMNQVL